jgi:hypothetical protein
MSDPDRSNSCHPLFPYVMQGSTAQACHPQSPSGWGGWGNFRPAGQVSPFMLDGWLLPDPQSPVARYLTPESILKCTAVATAAAKPFTIEDIPTVMRDKKSWPVAAALMARWFAGAEKKMTDKEKTGATPARDYPKEFVDTKTVTMEWIRTFARGDAGYKALKSKLSTPAAQAVLKTKAGAKSRVIKNAPDPVELHSDWQFQRLVVENPNTTSLDEMNGALANFGLYAAVLEGSVSEKPPQIKITKVGIYMRDTYDFNGAQYLGHWNSSGVGVDRGSLTAYFLFGKESHSSSDFADIGTAKPVNNSDYENWRTAHSKGGDLMIFSDVVTETVDITIAL